MFRSEVSCYMHITFKLIQQTNKQTNKNSKNTGEGDKANVSKWYERKNLGAHWTMFSFPISLNHLQIKDYEKNKECCTKKSIQIFF